MSMTDNARRAFDKLCLRGVTPIEVEAGEGNSITQFYLPHAGYYGDTIFADMDGNWIKEAWINGQWISPMGIRHDIHEIFAEHNLAHEWQDFGRLCIYDADAHDVTGWPHKDCNDRELARVKRSTKNKTVDSDSEMPPMSDAAFSAYCDLARIGAPVWDWHNYSHSYDPKALDAGTQFVMQCEPKFSIYFADPPEATYASFEATGGLRPDVHKIITKNRLTYRYYTHYSEDPRFNPKELVAFFDPNATPKTRGIA